MAKKEPTVSWQVLLDDAQWEREAPAPVAESARPRHWPSLPRRGLVLIALLLVLAVGVTGLVLWQRAQRGLATMQDEIENAALLESAAQRQQNFLLAETLLDPATGVEWRTSIVEGLMADHSAAPIPVVEDVEWLGGVALVYLTVSDPDLPQPSRVIRFYREQPAGWLRTAPVASSWGAEGLWEGEQFVFRFQERDRAAVLESAPKIDAVYVDLRQKLGLPVLPARQTVVVRPDDSPLAFDFPSKQLRQPSPHLLTLPATLDDQTALFRSVTLYLINDLVQESFDRYAYSPIWIWSNLTESGLRNWLQLESGVLGIDQRLLLPWLLDQEAQTERRMLPGVAEECQAMDALAVRVLFLSCTPDISSSLPSLSSLLQLSHLATTYDFDFAEDANTNVTPSGPMWHTETRQEIVAVTTVFLYAVETYGVERFPALLQALGDYRGWAEALPAAYAVSVADFEQGWHVWLAAEYGIER